MRNFPIRAIFAVVFVVLIVVLVRMFACSSSNVEAQQPTIADPTWTDCKSENGQVVLTGVFLNQATSTDKEAQVYVTMDLRAQGSGSATVDAYLDKSLIRFASIGNTATYYDVTSAETAAAFAEKKFKTAAYGYDNTIQGQTILSKEPTKLVAVFQVPRSQLAVSNGMSLWFDRCEAVQNQPASGVGYGNVILSFPTDFVRELPDEAAIVKKASDSWF